MGDSGQIITAAPAGPTRQRLDAFFTSKGARVRSLCRDTLVTDQRLVLDHERALWDGEDLLDGAAAAVVLDSGYMWPVPLLEPTEEQWEQHHGRFDDYLRDDRETASLWYSLLAVIEDRVPRCLNRAAAFANEAMKHDALEHARGAGLPVAPALTTNDPEAARAFAGRHAGPLLELPMVPGGAPRPMERDDLASLPLDRRPVTLLALERPGLLRLTAVGGVVVAADAAVPDDLRANVPAISRALHLEWGELVFGGDHGGWCLCDFSASPDLGTMAEDDAARTLELLWGLLA